MKHFVPFLVFFFLCCNSFSQTVKNDSIRKRPNVEAVRVTNSIVLDGVLSETEWQHPSHMEFVEREPDENVAPTQKSEAWIAYDDEAIYVAARLYDTAPESIVTRIGRRDADVTSDWFYFAIDSYHDHRNAFFFGVNPSGSISDGTFYNDSWSDNSWDGVWDVATKIDDKGWTLEAKVPYSQLRFTKQDEYTWGIDFNRHIERRKEEDYLCFVPKSEQKGVSSFADLVGIKNITPPTRVEFLPYIVSSNRLTNDYSQGDPFNSHSSQLGNVGGDLKVGLGSNLTLSGTINPDFGQVEVDPAVVNLSQFETFYDEKRPFFIEGSNYLFFGNGGSNNNWGFNWGNPQFFYSRRVGRAPQGDTQHDGYEDYPSNTTILGATKLTGKISDAWGFASVNAVTQQEAATVQDQTTNQRFHDVVEPLTSYNVVRSQREFNDGHQALGIIGTATIRNLNEPYLQDEFTKRALTFGIDGWANLDTSQLYVMTGWLATSRVEGNKNRISDVQQSSLRYYQRPDATHLSFNPNATSLSGYAGRFAINKQKGNFYLNTAFGFISPGFETNDLGYQFRADVLNAHVVMGYQWYDPDGIFRNKWFDVATYRSFDFGGNRISDGYFLFYGAQTLGYWSINGNMFFGPASYDNRNTRGGPLMKGTNGYGGYIYARTDSRKELIFGNNFEWGRTESGGYRASFGPEVQWKPGSNVTISAYPGFTRDVTMAQWVDKFSDTTAKATYNTRYVFGKIDQKEFSAGFRLDYTFTPKLSLQVYVQPLISVGKYNNFKELKKPATYTFNKYGENGSTITQATQDYYLHPNPADLTDSVSVSKGDYVVDADGSGASQPFVISNPDFNFKSLRGNAVLRWEFLPGSTLYFVWTQSQTNEDYPGDFEFGRDFKQLVTNASYQNVFLIKFSYWWNPS